MLVEVIAKNLPYVGSQGTVRDIPTPQAELLIRLGKVKKAEIVKKRRVYRRRDMRAETPEVVAEPVTVELDGAEPSYPAAGLEDE